MKTIKVIDLLNKIANNTLLDNTKVVIEDEVYTYNKKSKRLEKGSRYRIFSGEHLHKEVNVITNDKAEIIEEDKEIEYLGKQDLYVDDAKGYSVNIEIIGDKINEIIKTLNELKKGK